MNRSGMTAFVDTMVFLTVMMLAITVTASVMHPHAADAEPQELIPCLKGIEVRLSDFTDLGDESLVFLTDVMAYAASHDTELDDYLEVLLDGMYGQGRYYLTYGYGDGSRDIGTPSDRYICQETAVIPVSIGDSLYIWFSFL